MKGFLLTYILPPVITFALGYWSAVMLANRTERKTLIRDVFDKYCSSVRQEPSQQPQQFRLGALQRSGAALLSQKELDALIERVTGHGLPHPTRGDGILDQLPLLTLLRAGNERNIDLGSWDAFSDFVISITADSPSSER